MNYKVKKEDLKGDIKDFPIEVVQKMVDEQVRQGNKADVSVFQKAFWAGFEIGGFNWSKTDLKHNGWNDILSLKKYNEFFSKHPKQSYLKEDNPKTDKVVVKEKKVVKRTFRKLSEVKLLVTNRNRKAVIAFLDTVCCKKSKPCNANQSVNLLHIDCFLVFVESINDWYCPALDDDWEIADKRTQVKLRDIKRIHAREENRKQRELDKTKLFCETVEENVSHSESEVNKVYVSPFFTDESIEKIKELVRKVGEIKNKIGKTISITCANPLRDHVITREGVKYFSEKGSINRLKERIKQLEAMLEAGALQAIRTEKKLKAKLDKEVKTNEELSKMLNGKIEVLGRREAQLASLSVRNSDLNTANEKLRDYNDVLENKLGKEKLFRNIFILMFLISFLTLVAISLKY